jgi:lysophospholipase L1-like esterase
MFGSPSELHAKIVAYNGILKEEATKASAVYVDIFPLMESQAQKKMIASDGLHPSASAYDGWAAELAQRVKSPCH